MVKFPNATVAYDPRARAWYIRLDASSGALVESTSLELRSVNFDRDETGAVFGIEIL